MLAIVLSLLSAAGYGGSDYVAGLASREVSIIRVTIVAEAMSVVVMLAVVPWASSQTPSMASVAWGAAAGVGGVIGAMALYAGFRHAEFSVAGPLSAVASAGFSVLAGLLFGERPSGLSLLGIGLALPAIIGVSISSPSEASPAGQEDRDGAASHQATAGPAGEQHQDGTSGTGQAAGPTPAAGHHLAGAGWGLAAGAGFGVLFIGLNRAGSGADLWPAVVAQVTGLAAVLLIGAVRGQLRRLPARATGLGLAAGVMGAAGTICYFIATHAGLLAVAAVITSLYPAVTILLARFLLGERLTTFRLAGLCLAAASVALIAVGGAG